jgi:septal ring factor EnvC (AmiA/AmiB activator)
MDKKVFYIDKSTENKVALNMEYNNADVEPAEDTIELSRDEYQSLLKALELEKYRNKKLNSELDFMSKKYDELVDRISAINKTMADKKR